jgi:hypothetical protein
LTTGRRGGRTGGCVVGSRGFSASRIFGDSKELLGTMHSRQGTVPLSPTPTRSRSPLACHGQAVFQAEDGSAGAQQGRCRELPGPASLAPLRCRVVFCCRCLCLLAPGRPQSRDAMRFQLVPPFFPIDGYLQRTPSIDSVDSSTLAIAILVTFCSTPNEHRQCPTPVKQNHWLLGLKSLVCLCPSSPVRKRWLPSPRLHI